MTLAEASWHRMHSGDWALRVPGKRWAVAFVWRTFHRGYGYSAVSGSDNYSGNLANAKTGARRQWKNRGWP